MRAVGHAALPRGELALAGAPLGGPRDLASGGLEVRLARTNPQLPALGIENERGAGSEGLQRGPEGRQRRDAGGGREDRHVRGGPAGGEADAGERKLRLALRCKPHVRFMLATDAMPALGTDIREFELQGRRISVSGAVCYDEEGRLAGSNIDLASCVRNAIELLGLPLHEAVHMASLYPAEFLGLARELGRVEPGYRANLVLTDERLNVRASWIDGQPEGL